VSLTHGKAEAAGRDHWSSVARARHNRDLSGASEPALDLLEKYLDKGQNITAIQKERWAGDYPLSVLDEAIKELLPRINITKSSDLVRDYTSIPKRVQLEDIIRDIGSKNIDFPTIRNSSDDIFTNYGIPPLQAP